MITSIVLGSKTKETPGRITSNDPVAPTGVNSKKNPNNTPQIDNNKVENPVTSNKKLDVKNKISSQQNFSETREVLSNNVVTLEGVNEGAAELHGKAGVFAGDSSALVEKLKKRNNKWF
jgi:hypothetical protein